MRIIKSNIAIDFKKQYSFLKKVISEYKVHSQVLFSTIGVNKKVIQRYAEHLVCEDLEQA